MNFPFDDLARIETLAAVLISLVAGVLRGLTGFGSSMIMTPVLALLFGPVAAVATVLMLEVAVSVDAVARVWRDVPWPTMIQMWIAAWIAVPFGAWVLLVADPEILRRAMSLIVAILVVPLSMGWRYHGPHGLPSNLFVGAINGTMNASTGLGGPPIALYLLSGPSSARVARAGMLANVFVVSIPTVTILAFNGVIDAVVLWRAALIFPVFLIATRMGNRLFHAASERTYRRVAAVFLFIVALGTFLAAYPKGP
jgi:uncharacterized membrane protein YfcA